MCVNFDIQCGSISGSLVVEDEMKANDQRDEEITDCERFTPESRKLYY